MIKDEIMWILLKEAVRKNIKTKTLSTNQGHQNEFSYQPAIIRR
jgi:hypothetical protein